MTTASVAYSSVLSMPLKILTASAALAAGPGDVHGAARGRREAAVALQVVDEASMIGVVAEVDADDHLRGLVVGRTGSGR